MAAEVCHSPVIVSPRKPLAVLIPNVHGTPTKKVTGHKLNVSPFKIQGLSETTIAPALPVISVISSEESTKPSRKRAFEEMALSSQDDMPRTQQTVGTSFSSLIDYNAKHSSPDFETMMEANEDDTSVKARANVLKLRLQMAFFRVQTNQLQIPLADLRLPDSNLEEFIQGDNRMNGDAEPKTPYSNNRNRSFSRSSAVSEDELPPLPDEMIKAHNSEVIRREKELTSSAVKGRAISGLLELSRG